MTGSRRRKIPLLNFPRSDAASEQHARHLGEELGVLSATSRRLVELHVMRDEERPPPSRSKVSTRSTGHLDQDSRSPVPSGPEHGGPVKPEEMGWSLLSYGRMCAERTFRRHSRRLGGSTVEAGLGGRRGRRSGRSGLPLWPRTNGPPCSNHAIIPAVNHFNYDGNTHGGRPALLPVNVTSMLRRRRHDCAAAPRLMGARPRGEDGFYDDSAVM